MPKLVNREGELVEKARPTPQTLITSDAEISFENSAGGIRIPGDYDYTALQAHLASASLIAIELPAFMDGRAFSLGRLISDDSNFKGELRACGDFMLDQLHYLKRCGFDSFELADNASLASAKGCLAAFSEHYQAAVLEDKPLYRRVSRPSA